MKSITYGSSREWLYRHQLKIDRFLRRNFKIEDRGYVYKLIFHDYPDEGMKLVKNFDLSNEEKINKIVEYIITAPQLTGIILGDQRFGKDATACKFLEFVLERVRYQFFRIVTLGNIKKPPWVADKDMYYSFANIPNATGYEEVLIYCSELEVVFPAREFGGTENRIFSTLEGTTAQNHQKILGCVKLLSKVDLNVIRSANMKMFKFISPSKLKVEGVERDGVISGLGKLLLPNNPQDKSKVLVAFDNNLFTVSLDLPDWWTTSYSEMFSNISMDMINEYITTMDSNGLKPDQIWIAVKQKFRKNLTKEYIKDYLKLKV